MIVLDTHVLLWLCGDPSRLSRAAAALIENESAKGETAIAGVTLFEIAQLAARGRITFGRPVAGFLSMLVETSGVAVLGITAVIAALAVNFPRDFPKDPADRIIAATARAEGATLVTRDERIRRSKLVMTAW